MIVDVGIVMDQKSTEQLARLWTQSQSVVSSYVLSLVRDFHLAEDILQQVAVILVREFEKYDPSRPFLPWALGFAKNVALKSRAQSGQGCQSFARHRLNRSHPSGVRTRFGYLDIASARPARLPAKTKKPTAGSAPLALCPRFETTRNCLKNGNLGRRRASNAASFPIGFA